MSTEDIQPTDEGKIRYASSDGYNLDVDPKVPCTCKQSCQARCAGECGCQACSLQFTMYAEMRGWLSDKPFEATAAQLAQYRGEPEPRTLAGSFEDFMLDSGLARRYANQPTVVADLLLAFAHGNASLPVDDGDVPVLPDQVDELTRQLQAGDLAWYPKP